MTRFSSSLPLGCRLALVGLVALTAIAVAQPDPTQPPGAPGSGSDPGSAAGSGSGSATGSGSGTGSATGSGSGSGSGKTGPRIIPIPTDINAPEVSAAAAPTTITLGTKFTVFVTATFNQGVEVNLREPLDLGTSLEITKRLSEDKPTGDGRTTREWQLEVIAWDLGDLIIPPIAVTYTAFGHADQVGTNPVKIKVTGMLGDLVDDPKAMRPSAPPQELLARDWFWLWVGGAAFGGILILFALISRHRRKRRMDMVGLGFATSTPIKFDSASDRALYKLKEIEKSGVLDRDDDRKKGYAEMVEVIREYIGSRYRVATLDLTSSELIKKLEKAQAPKDERDMIERWLDRCDIVKYGGLKASADEAKATLEAARQLVVTTTAKPTAEPIKPEPPPPPAPPPPDQPPPTSGPPDEPPQRPSSDDAPTTPFTKPDEEAA